MPIKDKRKLIVMAGNMTLQLRATKTNLNDGETFYVEGEAIRPGTYTPANFGMPVHYGADIMPAVAKQLKGAPIRYVHTHMDTPRNIKDNLVGHVLDTKVTQDGKVFYHGIIQKALYLKFVAAMVDEEGVDPRLVPDFIQFCNLIRQGSLSGASVGLKVDTEWNEKAKHYDTSNPNTDEISLVPEGAVPTAYAGPSSPSGGLMVLNSATYDNGEIFIFEDKGGTTTGNDKYQNNTPKDTVVVPKDTAPDDMGVLVGLARRGADAVGLDGTSEATLTSLIKYMDVLRARMWSQLHDNIPGEPPNNNEGEDPGQPKKANNTKKVIIYA